MQDRLQALLNRITDRWNGLEKNQKIRVIIIAIVLVLALSATIFIIARPKTAVLLQNQNALDILDVEEALNEKGVWNSVTNNGTSIVVREKDYYAARVAVQTNQVTKTKGFTFLDMLANTGMGSTEKDKNLMYKETLQTQISRMLEEIEGVEKATVLLETADDTKFFLPDNISKASVMLNTSKPIDADVAQSMANMVAAGVKNLSIENVLITDQKGADIFSATSSGSMGAIKTYRDAEMVMKEQIEKEIRNAATPMYDNVQVISNLEYDWDKISEQSKKYTNPIGDEAASGLIGTESQVKQNYTNATPDAEPGQLANDMQTATYETGGGENSNANISEREANYLYDVIELNREGQIGKLLKDNSGVSVFLYKNIYHDEAKMRANNELTDITWEQFKKETPEIEPVAPTPADEEFIAALKIGTGINNLTAVSRNTNIFIDEVVEPVKIGEIVALAFAALLVVLLAIGVARKTQPEEVAEIEPELSVEDLIVSNTLDDKQTTEAEKLMDIELGVDSEVKRQIEKFVDEKPEAVSQLLRNWLNQDWE